MNLGYQLIKDMDAVVVVINPKNTDLFKIEELLKLIQNSVWLCQSC